jgi:putative nucleotidyltransferase with HDIG domain
MTALTLETVVAKVRQIPSLSIVVAELLASFDSEDVDIGYLVGKISQDQGLAARVLRVANSAFYGLSSRVGSVGEAVTVLGFHAVRSLALAAGITKVLPHKEGGRFDALAFWQHAVGCGVAARILALRAGKNPETAFTAGLLHDIGKLALDTYFREAFDAVLAYRAEHGCLMTEAEHALLGFDHAAVGFEMARQWHFPPAIQQAIRDHHEPDAAAAFLTDAVHAAEVLCYALDIGSGGNDRVPQLSARAWQRIGLGWDAIDDCLREIEQTSDGMSLLVTD